MHTITNSNCMFFCQKNQIKNTITNCMATPARFFSELKGKTCIIEDFDLASSKFIPSCRKTTSMHQQVWLNNGEKKHPISNDTLTPQERIAFSVGDPLSSITPPSCSNVWKAEPPHNVFINPKTWIKSHHNTTIIIVQWMVIVI